MHARSRAVTGPLLVGLGVAAATAYVVLVDPAAGGGRYPTCPFLTLTGRPCPLCGGLRAVHAAGRGDLVGAASSNLLVVLLLALAALGWLHRVRSRLAGRAVRAVPAWLYLAGAAAFVCFGIVRNLPFGAWLTP